MDSPTPPPNTRQRARANAAGLRRVAVETRAAEARRVERRRQQYRWGSIAAMVLALTAVGTFLVTRGGDSPAVNDLATVGAPKVGGDLHTVTVVGNAIYVGGHAAVAVSRDGGRRWKQVPSLEGADAMGWAATSDSVLVGGHPGLYRSTDDGASFLRVTGAGAVPDVHALGGVGSTVYLASPQAGLLASADGGRNWQVRNPQVGRSFMGTILVDPKNTQRLVAPDMSGGLTTSTDGGRSWEALGGPMGAMAAAWKPTNTKEILAVGMEGGVRSTDGGTTWHRVELPRGTSALSYDSTGRILYAGVLDGERARTYRSSNDGTTWRPTG